MKDASSSVASGAQRTLKAANDNAGKKVSATFAIPPAITVVEVEVFASLLDGIGEAANDND